MFCSHCGKEIQPGTKFCPGCGADVSAESRVAHSANKAFREAEGELNNAVNEVRDTFQNGGAGYAGERLTDNRGLISYILLTLVTCGIYSYYFVYKLAHDVNIACSGDGEETGGLLQYILLSIVTCGLYSLYWEYKLANRLATNAPRYGLTFQENGTTVLMWHLVGAVLCGIGPLVAMNILIKNSNKICNAYNRYNNL